MAIAPRGRTTTTSNPAAAPYAAAEADVFPVEAQMIDRAPASMAFETATTMPRSLNEPVGFRPSSLRWSRGTPILAPRRRASISGVNPSPSVSCGVASVIGRNARYRSTSLGRIGKWYEWLGYTRRR